MDKFHNIDNLVKQLKTCKCSIILDKEIDINLIKLFKEKIIELVLYVDEKTNIEYVKALKTTGVELFLLSKLNEKNLNKLKLKYIDIAPLFQKEDIKIEDVEELGGKKASELYYINSSRIISNDGIRSSYGAEAIPSYEYSYPNLVVDDPEFWADLDRTIILEKTS